MGMMYFGWGESVKNYFRFFGIFLLPPATLGQNLENNPMQSNGITAYSLVARCVAFNFRREAK